MSVANENDDGGLAAEARQRAIQAYEQAREGAADAGRKARDSLTEAPLLALAGEVAVGAIIAALLPRTAKAEELVGPTAKRLKQSAKAAVDAARETGGQKLEELGLTRDKGTAALKSLLSDVGEAVKASADAAAGAVRKG